MPDELELHCALKRTYGERLKMESMAKKVFLQLASVIHNAKLYSPADPTLLGSAEHLCLLLEEVLSRQKTFVFAIRSGELFFDSLSVPVDESSAFLIDELSARGIGAVLFKSGIIRREVMSFAFLMRRFPQGTEGEGDWNGLLVKNMIDHIFVHGPLPSKPGKRDSSSEKIEAFALYADAIDAIKSIGDSMQTGRDLPFQRLEAVVHGMVDSILKRSECLLSLTGTKLNGEYPFVHPVNVAVLSLSLGARLSLDKQQLTILGFAAMMHDLGKVNVPLSADDEQNGLTEYESEIIKHHPVIGALILSAITGINSFSLVPAFEHHISCDSNEYPWRRSRPPHPFSQIVAITDTYDALTSLRVYYAVPRPPDYAIRTLLKNSGSAFDSLLVKVFVNMVGLLPIGTVLQLSSGETGIVVQQTSDLLRPRILLLSPGEGNDDSEEVSLLQIEKGKYKRSITRILESRSMKTDRTAISPDLAGSSAKPSFN